MLLCPIGDTLMATPALAAVRRRFPRTAVTVVASASNAGVLDANPDVDQLMLVPAPDTGSLTARFSEAVRQISGERMKYDLVISLSAAGTLVALLAGLGGPRLRLSMPPLWWLVGGHSASFRARHTVDQYLRAIEPLLDRPLTPDERAPRLYLTLHDRSASRRLLREHGLSPSTVLVTMHAGGDGFDGRKRWATECFAEVARGLIERCDAHVLLVGGKDDEVLSQETAALVSDGITVLAGRTSLKVTAALIEQSSLFIGNDSGPLHMAAAVGTPAVGIFGPSDWRQFQPIGRKGYRQRVLHSNLPCSPCFRFIGNDPWWYHNPCYSRACLEAVSPERVLTAALELLEARQ
jgi:ADP-heptose:LPS heptosyltransferase